MMKRYLDRMLKISVAHAPLRAADIASEKRDREERMALLMRARCLRTGDIIADPRTERHRP